MRVREIKAGAKAIKNIYKKGDRMLSFVYTVINIVIAIAINISKKFIGKFVGYTSFQYIVFSAILTIFGLAIILFGNYSKYTVDYGFVQTLHKQKLGVRQEVGSLFLPFQNEFGATMKMFLFEMLIVAGLLVIPFALFFYLFVRYRVISFYYGSSVAQPILYYIVGIVLLMSIIILFVKYVYYLVNYIRTVKFHNGEKIGTIELFRQSRKLMKGYKFFAFKLDLSFLLFDILNLLCLGLLEIFFLRQYRTYSYLILSKEVCDKNGIVVNDELNSELNDTNLLDDKDDI